MKFLCLTLAAVLVLSGCGDDSSAPPQATAKAPQIKAEQLVTMKDATFLCGTKDEFVEAVTHGHAGEKTKLTQMFNDGKCWTMEPTAVMRVIHVDSYEIEVAPNSDAADVSAWTAPEFVAQSVPKS